MNRTIVQVDAFTDVPWRGNPAAVWVGDAPAPEAWMRAVAAEMNLSETAFLHPEDDGWRLRWFTPTVEVELCGHATLASAHVLWEEGHVPAGGPLRFHTRSGPLAAIREGEWIALDFPATPVEEVVPPAALLQALTVGADEVEWVGRNERDWLVLLDGARAVRRVAPDFRALAAVAARGVIVTAAGGDEETGDVDFVSRFFAPAYGVDEDPVTGSAHCSLGPFWCGRLERDEVVGYQASRRGGRVRVRPRGERVAILGRAVTVMRGELEVAGA